MLSPLGSGKEAEPPEHRPTCSAQVTPAMPPPTTTNFPAVGGGRAASMLPDSQWFTEYRGGAAALWTPGEEAAARRSLPVPYPENPTYGCSGAHTTHLEYLLPAAFRKQRIVSWCSELCVTITTPECSYSMKI